MPRISRGNLGERSGRVAGASEFVGETWGSSCLELARFRVDLGEFPANTKTRSLGKSDDSGVVSR